jgi:hypothetical protein
LRWLAARSFSSHCRISPPLYGGAELAAQVFAQDRRPLEVLKGVSPGAPRHLKARQVVPDIRSPASPMEFRRRLVMPGPPLVVLPGAW